MNFTVDFVINKLMNAIFFTESIGVVCVDKHD